MKTATTRFDFEQQLMDCWGIVDDIKTIYELPDMRKVEEDELQNLLLGLYTLYQIKFEKLFAQFDSLVTDKKLL
jgi:hypothetical protein